MPVSQLVVRFLGFLCGSSWHAGGLEEELPKQNISFSPHPNGNSTERTLEKEPLGPCPASPAQLGPGMQLAELVPLSAGGSAGGGGWCLWQLLIGEGGTEPPPQTATHTHQ